MTWLRLSEDIREMILSFLVGKPDDGRIPTAPVDAPVLIGYMPPNGSLVIFGTLSVNRVQEHIIFPHRCIVRIQGDRVESYRGVVYKVTNNGEELLEEHEYYLYQRLRR